MAVREKVRFAGWRLVWLMLLMGWGREAQALDVQVENRPLVDFLPWLANEVGESVIISPEIDAKVSLIMRDTNWTELLAAIAEQHHLAVVWQGDTALLSNKLTLPVAALTAEGTGVSLPKDCRTQFWSLQHARAQAVGKHLATLYPSLKISMDPRTNSVITQACTAVMDLDKTVAWLDSPLRQIEISARIAQVRSNAQSQLGVNWQTQLSSNTLTSSLGGAIDLGALQSSTALSFALTKGERLLSLTLDLLESEGDAKIISEPKVVTAEGQPAIIQSGTEVPYQSKDADGVKVEFKQAGLMLEVTPFVKDNNKIQLNLKIHQDAVGDLVNGIPSLETNRVQTQVVVVDQETLVLGGIYRDERLTSESKVPFLGDLPWIGGLFKRRIERQEKVELLVFITPKLLQMTNN